MQLTARYPFPYSGDMERTVRDLQDWAVGLLDSLKPTLNNLDAGNVLEAASVRAENINTRHAKIKDAQIQDLTADKITAGTIDAQEIDVVNMIADNIVTGTLKIKNDMKIENGEGTVELDSESFTICDDEGNPRIQMGKTNVGSYIFAMYAKPGEDGKQETKVYFNDNGQFFCIDATVQGIFQTGAEGTARTIINENGIQSYDSSNKKSGLWSNDASEASGQRFADLKMYYKEDEIFKVYNGLDHISLWMCGKNILNVGPDLEGDKSCNALGKWKYTNSKNGVSSELATQQNVDDLQDYLEGQINKLKSNIESLQAQVNSMNRPSFP